MMQPQKFKKSDRSAKMSCKDYALFLVSLRAQSIGQLQAKLEKKGYSAEDISAAIIRLSELNYLNDEQFAQIYLDNLKKYKNFGYFGIKKKLMEKKIAPKQVERLLKDFTIKEELDIAKRLIEKSSKKSREQQVRSLQGKGFRTDVIFKATKVLVGEE